MRKRRSDKLQDSCSSIQDLCKNDQLRQKKKLKWLNFLSSKFRKIKRHSQSQGERNICYLGSETSLTGTVCNEQKIANLEETIATLRDEKEENQLRYKKELQEIKSDNEKRVTDLTWMASTELEKARQTIQNNNEKQKLDSKTIRELLIENRLLKKQMKEKKFDEKKMKLKRINQKLVALNARQNMKLHRLQLEKNRIEKERATSKTVFIARKLITKNFNLDSKTKKIILNSKSNNEKHINTNSSCTTSTSSSSWSFKSSDSDMSTLEMTKTKEEMTTEWTQNIPTKTSESTTSECMDLNQTNVKEVVTMDMQDDVWNTLAAFDDGYDDANTAFLLDMIPESEYSSPNCSPRDGDITGDILGHGRLPKSGDVWNGITSYKRLNVKPPIQWEQLPVSFTDVIATIVTFCGSKLKYLLTELGGQAYVGADMRTRLEITSNVVQSWLHSLEDKETGPHITLMQMLRDLMTSNINALH